MWSIVNAAGWPIWTLIIASVVALAIIIERLVSLRTSNILPEGLLAKTVQEFRRAGASAELLGRLQSESPLGRVFAAGLRNHQHSRDITKEAIEETGRAVGHELERFLTTLGTIAAMAPLLGLLGTVIGMIEIFAAQTPGGGNPQQLAHGISVALYNTAFGLMVAIPSMMFYRYFRARVDGLLIDMEQQAIKLVEVLHGDRS